LTELNLHNVALQNDTFFEILGPMCRYSRVTDWCEKVLFCQRIIENGIIYLRVTDIFAALGLPHLNNCYLSLNWIAGLDWIELLQNWLVMYQGDVNFKCAWC